jgi:curved DNA-binding protein CbpA
MPIKDNQRNYYRILQVQPDASVDIIKSNYRTLLQKLHLHPDLGGEDWNASLINIAYATLRNPTKRAAYDQQLLRKLSISTLAGNHLNTTSSTSDDQIDEPQHERKINKRNYYRILNIQPDAAAAIIKTSYQTLLNKSKIPKVLLREAYNVLGDPEKRAAYDRLRANYTHVASVKRTKSGVMVNQTARKNENPPSVKTTSLAKKIVNYQATNDQHCAFCQTSFSEGTSQYDSACCVRCDSPLHPPAESLRSQPRRVVSRMEQNSTISFYKDWPGQEYTATLDDLSPTGLRMIEFCSVDKFSTPVLNKGQIIKITSQNFKAVGEITYHHRKPEKIIYGIRFLTIVFHNQKGQFLNLTA